MPTNGIVFDHIAFGVARIADSTPFLVGELGGKDVGGGPSPEFRAHQWSYAGGGCIEILEPCGPPGGFLHRFLEARGPGFHHVTFKVPDLRAICDRAEQLGYTVIGYDDSSPSWKEAFLHPKEALGIVVQFAESHPELGQGEWGPEQEPPLSPPGAERTVRLVGLRLRARTAERARRQWGELLGGDVREDGGSLAFAWPTSPMTLTVDIAPDESEGPVCLELAEAEHLSLPRGRHPVLGALVVRLDAVRSGC